MDYTHLIPWAISGASLLVAFFTYQRNGRKDVSQEHESLLKANMKLDQICATTNETRSDIKSLYTSLNEMDKRIGIIENEQKTIWKRFDELKEEKS